MVNDFTLNESKVNIDLNDQLNSNTYNLYEINHFNSSDFKTPLQASQENPICSINQIIQDTEPSFAKNIKIPTEPQSHL